MSEPTHEFDPNDTHSAGGPSATTSDGSAPPADVAGRYVLGAEMARGGMGVVYRATDTILGRPVAVKVLHTKYGPQSVAARRFAGEARIAGQLQHPGIPPVHDLGTLPDGRPFLAMKLIKGDTLDRVIAADPSRAVAAFEQVCHAVGYAHAHGVIHRDLKPSNVMVGAFGEVQVMDWGLAKLLALHPAVTHPSGDPDRTVTVFEDPREDIGLEESADGSVLGTLAYMPPEQATGLMDQIGPHSDVFGLGGILCEILTGKPPYVAETASEVRALAVRGKVDAAFARLDATDADPGLIALCKRCLSAELEDRPPDAGEVAREVATLRAAADERARVAEVERERATVREGEQRKRRRVQLALLASVFVLAAAGGVFSWWWSGRANRNAAALTEIVSRCRAALEGGDADKARAALADARLRIGDGGGAEFAPTVEGLEVEAELLDALAAIDAFAFPIDPTRSPTDEALAERYAQTFSRFGFGFGEAETAATATRIDRSPVRNRLLAALDGWLLVAPDAGVRAVLTAVDPDPFREQVRAAVLARNGAAVASLAADSEVLTQPVWFTAAFAQPRNRFVPEDRRREIQDRALRERPQELALLSRSLRDALTRADRERDRALSAERQGRERLLRSYISEARGILTSRRVGQRFESLAKVQQAVALAKELNAPPETFGDLRAIATAALALPDLRPDTAWVSRPDDIDASWNLNDISPDYRHVIYAHQTGAISVRRVGTGPDDCGEVLRLPNDEKNCYCRFSPDGRWFAVWHVFTKRVRVYKLADEPAEPVVFESFGCLGVAFSGDSRRVYTLTGDTLRTYSLADGKQIRTTRLPKEVSRLERLLSIRQLLAVHPKSESVAVALPNGVLVLDGPTGRVVARQSLLLNPDAPLTSPTLQPNHLAWHPTEPLLAVGFKHGFQLWDVSTPRPRVNWVLEQQGQGAFGRFSPDGQTFAVSGWSGELHFWDPHTGRELLSTFGDVAQFRPGGRLATRFPTAADDPAGPLSIYQPPTALRTMVIHVGGDPVNSIETCSFHPDGRLMAVSSESGFSLLDLDAGRELQFDPDWCRQVLFEPGGSLLVTHGSLFRWPVHVLPDAGLVTLGPPELIEVSESGQTVARNTAGDQLAVSTGRGAVVWQRNRPWEDVFLPHDDCRHVAVGGDGKYVTTGSWHGRGLKVWNRESGKLERTLLPGQLELAPTMSANGKWLANRTGPLWEVGRWDDPILLPANTHAVAFCPQTGVCACSLSTGAIALIDPPTGRELVRLEDPERRALTGLAFSHDGTRLGGVSKSGRCVRVWDLAALRGALAGLGLDWDADPLPQRKDDRRPDVLTARVIGRELITDWNARRRQQGVDLTLRLFHSPQDPHLHAEAGKFYRSLAERMPDPFGRLGFEYMAYHHLTVAIGLGADTPTTRYFRATAAAGLKMWDVVDTDTAAFSEQLGGKARPLVYPDCLRLRIVALLQLDRLKDAAVELRKQWRQNGGEVARLWAVVVEQCGTEAALDQFRRLSGELSDQPDLRTDLAVAVYKAGRRSEGMAMVRSLLEVHVGDVDWVLRQGQWLTSVGQFELAETLYRAALDRHPAAEAIAVNLADTLLVQNKVAPAIPLLERVVARGRVPDEALLAVGLVAPVVDRRRTLPHALVQLGLAYSRRGEWEQTEAHIRRAVRLNPDEPFVHFWHAFALERVGDLTAAVEAYRTALLHPPVSLDTHDRLARLLATGPDQLRDGPGAMLHAETACGETNYRNPTYLATLAAAHAAAGEFDDAVRVQNQALALPLSRSRAADYRRRLDLYTAGKPYLDPALQSK